MGRHIVSYLIYSSYKAVHPPPEQNNGKEMYKKVCFTCKVTYLLIRPIVVFHLSPALPSPLSITRFYILFERTINIIEIFAFSPGWLLYITEIIVIYPWKTSVILAGTVTCSRHSISGLARDVRSSLNLVPRAFPLKNGWGGSLVGILPLCLKITNPDQYGIGMEKILEIWFWNLFWYFQRHIETLSL